MRIIKDMKKTLSLFITFFWLGLITFGGGLAMLPLIRHQAIHRQWIKKQDWEGIVTLSQLTPGAIAVNCANIIGLRYHGKWGGFVSVWAIVLGPMLVITLLGVGLQTWLNMPWVVAALKGMFLVVFVLLTYAVVNLGKYAWQSLWMVPISFLSFTLVYLGILTPWMLILLGTLSIVMLTYGRQRR